MTEEQEPELPPSDHAAHTAPAEPHPIKKNLWQRWMAWSGSFLVISILAHVILIGGAALLVVKVVQSRKDKMKFTAPPPSPAGMVEHKVKPSKKAAAAPAISKRITSTAANTSIALPAMEMNSTGPDVMASVMSGLGAAGLGSGAAGGAAGMASMPLAGLTAFGFKGATGNIGLRGHIYDLKQTSNGGATAIKDDGSFKNPHLLDSIPDDKVSYGARSTAYWEVMNDKSTLGKRSDLVSPSLFAQADVVNEFMRKDWDESILKKFYESKDPVTAFQFLIERASSKSALQAFGVEKEVKPSHFLIHYKGYVRAPKDGEFRFRGWSIGTLLIRFDNQNVFGRALFPFYDLTSFTFKNTDNPGDKRLRAGGTTPPGKWFRVDAGKKYPIEILQEASENNFGTFILIEDRNPEQPYKLTIMNELYPKDPPTYLYPPFALMKGLPIPAIKKEDLTSQKIPDSFRSDKRDKWRPWLGAPECAQEPLIFPGAK
ncbi:MAG: hypothetical protein WCR44_04075 [Verrucomicrobiota bacterium]